MKVDETFKEQVGFEIPGSYGGYKAIRKFDIKTQQNPIWRENAGRIKSNIPVK